MVFRTGLQFGSKELFRAEVVRPLHSPVGRGENLSAEIAGEAGGGQDLALQGLLEGGQPGALADLDLRCAQGIEGEDVRMVAAAPGRLRAAVPRLPKEFFNSTAPGGIFLPEAPSGMAGAALGEVDHQPVHPVVGDGMGVHHGQGERLGARRGAGPA